MLGNGTKSGLSRDQVGGQHNLLEVNVLRLISEILDPAATQVTMQVAMQVMRMLDSTTSMARSRQELQDAAQMKNRKHFRKAYMEPLVRTDLLALTIPDKPTSRLQKYRLTEKEKRLLKSMQESS
jgi:hypothetical protein